MSLVLASLLATAGAASLEASPGDDLNTFVEGLGPGDEIVLGNGQYDVSATLAITVVATEDQPVTLRAKNPGEAIFQVAPNAEGAYPSALFSLNGASHVTLDGLVLQGDETWTQAEDNRYQGLTINESSNITVKRTTLRELNRTGVYLSGNNRDITLDTVEVAEITEGYGLYMGCSDASCWTTGLTITNGLFHDFSGTDAVGIYLAHGSQGARIEDTVVYGTTGTGIYLGSTERGEKNTLLGNAVWSTVGAGVFVDGDVQMQNNLIFNIDGHGIRTRNPDRDSFSDLILTYNTVVDTTGWAAYLSGWQDADGTVVLSSNALCNPVGYGVNLELVQLDTAIPETPGYVTNNVVCGLVEGLDEYDGEIIPGGGFADFADAESWDFYPTPSAQLLDAGDPASEAYIPSTDFNGAPRSASPDAGAYEFDGEGNPGWRVQENFKELGVERPSEVEVLGGCSCKKNGSSDTGAAALLLLPLLGFGALRRRDDARPPR